MTKTSPSYADVYRDTDDRVFFRLTDRQGRTKSFAVEADDAETLDRWLDDNNFTPVASEELHPDANVLPFVRTSGAIH